MKLATTQNVLIHTGGVDAMWRDCQSRPYHVVSRPEPTAMWTQNWCEASGCGSGVGWTPKPKAFWRSLVAPWRSAWRCEREKHRSPFQEQISCKLQDIIKKHFNPPGNFKPISGNESVVSLWRKRHVFSKRSKRWRGYPPDGKFLHLPAAGISCGSNVSLWVAGSAVEDIET